MVPGIIIAAITALTAIVVAAITYYTTKERAKDTIRIISARLPTRKEREDYEENVES
jgi:uncharacterized DUF497 family protein